MAKERRKEGQTYFFTSHQLEFQKDCLCSYFKSMKIQLLPRSTHRRWRTAQAPSQVSRTVRSYLWQATRFHFRFRCYEPAHSLPWDYFDANVKTESPLAVTSVCPLTWH